MSSKNLYYNIFKQLFLKVDTQNIPDNDTVQVKITLYDKDNKQLGQKRDTTRVTKDLASYKFSIENIAKEKSVDITKVDYVKLWIDNDGDGEVDYDEELTIHVKKNILISDMLKENTVLNNIASNKISKTYQKAPRGTAKVIEELKLIQKALKQMKIDIGSDGVDGKFGSDMKQAIKTFQTNYKPSHKTHKNYTIKETSEISKDDILAIDEALIDGWALQSKRVSSPWKLSKKAIEFLKGYESEVKKDGKHILYNDDSGYCTIGYGHLVNGRNSCHNISNISQNFKNGLTDSQAEELLLKDIEKREQIINKIIKVPLFQQEFDALFSVYYNIPSSLSKNKTIMTKLNLLDYEGAKKGILLWNKATYNGVFQTLNGLRKRREAEAKIFEKGIYDSTH